MKCPFCGAEDTKVLDSRPADEGFSIRRRRQCDDCGKRFTTYERTETLSLMVVKKGNERELYSKSKIYDGVMRACHKRPVSAGQIEKLVDEVDEEVTKTDKKEVSTKFIGELVMKKLRDLDAVAYVRFASVYREFKDAETFMEELKRFLK